MVPSPDVVSVVSVLCDQVNQVVQAHQVDDIDEAHQVDTVHQVDQDTFFKVQVNKFK